MTTLQQYEVGLNYAQFYQGQDMKYTVLFIILTIFALDLCAQTSFTPRNYPPALDPVRVGKIPLEKNPYLKNGQIVSQSELNNIADHIQNLTTVELGLNASLTENNFYQKKWTQPKNSALFMRTLRWKTGLPVTDCVIVQIAAREFSASVDWNSPAHLVAETSSCQPKRADGWHYVPALDFAHLEKYPPFSYKPLVIMPGNPVNRMGLYRPIDLRMPSIPAPGPGFPLEYVTRFEINHSQDLFGFFDTKHYFIRVIPIKNALARRPIAKISPSAVLFYAADPNPTPVLYNGLPDIRVENFTGMRPDHFNFYCFVEFHKDIKDAFGNVLFAKGSIGNVCDDSDGGFWGSITGFFSDLWAALTSFVDYIANIYNSIKATLTSWVATMIGCETNKACQNVIGALISYSAIAMGIPPEIPNSDQLLSMGSDYLAESIANQTGIPAEVAEIGTDALKAQLTQAHQAGQENNPTFISLAGIYQYRPSYLKIRVHKSTESPAAVYESQLRIENEENFYNPIMIKLPRNTKRTSGNYSVPLFLEPSTNYRGWLATHNRALEELGSGNLNNFVQLERQAQSEYTSFYNAYSFQAMHFRVNICNQLACEKVGRFTCSGPGTSSCTYEPGSWH
ncbi:MAG: hypothetical protein A2X86_02875 [Bdellovibrionales bacterium GWA2_49_15]|nr:MAG: hypothetical protein A2X86_02875 [Bdellovibrionales bacterium GWA2_49_15]HAZ14117.1 hypothetical protein [Bdellovibrionales bacterium]